MRKQLFFRVNFWFSLSIYVHNIFYFDSIVFVSDFNYSSKVSSNNIGLGVFSGFDFFITDGLYVGTELGFQLLSTKFSRGEFKQMDASSTTAPEIVTAIPENKNTALGNSGVGVIRLGWMF